MYTCCSDAGHMLLRCWSHAAQMLVTCCSDAGHMLLRCWSHTTHMLINSKGNYSVWIYNACHRRERESGCWEKNGLLEQCTAYPGLCSAAPATHQERPGQWREKCDRMPSLPQPMENFCIYVWWQNAWEATVQFTSHMTC